MLIIGFAEGANPARGGLGLVGVPLILGGLAGRGHQVALVACGGCTPGRERFLAATVDEALSRKEGAGSFGVVMFKAARAWAFAPAMLWRLNRHVRRADFVSLHSLYSFPVFAGYLLARFHGVPYGLWPHGVLAPVQRRVSARKKRIYDSLIARRILKHAAVLFFSAPGERDEALSLRLNTPSVIIPDGMDLSEFAAFPPRGRFRARYLAKHQGPLVISIGRLNAKKGLDLLIDAMTEVVSRRPNARLAIIGPPDPPHFTQRVMDWLRKKNLESNTVVAGPLDPMEKLEALADADVFVSSSEAENFGFSVFEAMASRVPVVVSDTLDFAREIAQAGAGVATPRNRESFADAIVQFLDDPVLRRETGLKGMLLAKRYSMENTGLKIEQTINNILNHRPVNLDAPDPVSCVDLTSTSRNPAQASAPSSELT
jgi:glycosyltransferase involved in cell wall biosynthesis